MQLFCNFQRGLISLKIFNEVKYFDIRGILFYAGLTWDPGK